MVYVVDQATIREHVITVVVPMPLLILARKTTKFKANIMGMIMNVKHSFYGLLVLFAAFGAAGIAVGKDEVGTVPRDAADSAKANRDNVLEGKVVEVIDGNTLTVQFDKKKYDVLLLGIIAPQKTQPFSDQSKKALAKKVLDKKVQIIPFRQEKSGLILGTVVSGGSNINTEMVREGFAWNYEEFPDAASLPKYQADAKKAKLGLWAAENPMPPWQWHQPAAEKTLTDEKTSNRDSSTTLKPQADQTKSYWLTVSSNVRHNSKCRYYQKSKGRPCGPDEGTPCKVCGG